MNFINIKKNHFLSRYQMPISLCIITGVSIILFYAVPLWGYRVPALVLLMIVSLFALKFNITTVIVSSISSALIWNFFFIPPVFTFHISNGEDGLMFLMYFILALVHTTLSFKIKEAEKINREKENKEKTIKLYNTLFNSLSHELKTPIAAIIGAVDTIKENELNFTEATKKELINEIGIASIRLNKEVENLLNMSRLEAGSIILNLDWTDINEVVHMVLTKLEEKVKSHHILFEPNDTLPFVKIDSILIEQAIYNIVNNALLYTPAGSTIQIIIKIQNEVCEILIKDNGPGFPAHELENVFKVFYRIPSNKTGGLGLGLSISKGFIEAHNGTIQLSSSAQNETIFTIVLPVQLSYINNIKNE